MGANSDDSKMCTRSSKLLAPYDFRESTMKIRDQRRRNSEGDLFRIINTSEKVRLQRPQRRVTYQFGVNMTENPARDTDLDERKLDFNSNLKSSPKLKENAAEGDSDNTNAIQKNTTVDLNILEILQSLIEATNEISEMSSREEEEILNYQNSTNHPLINEELPADLIDTVLQLEEDYPNGNFTNGTYPPKDSNLKQLLKFYDYSTDNYFS